MSIRRPFLLALPAAALLACPWLLQAAPAAAGSAAAAASPAVPGMAGELLRVVLGLIAVVAVILGAGWFGRRAQSRVRGGGRHMRCLETLAVGAKERVLLMEVGEKQLVVGVTPGGLRTLLVLDEKLTATSTETVPGTNFRSLLTQWKKPS